MNKVLVDSNRKSRAFHKTICVDLVFHKIIEYLDMDGFQFYFSILSKEMLSYVKYAFHEKVKNVKICNSLLDKAASRSLINVIKWLRRAGKDGKPKCNFTPSTVLAAISAEDSYLVKYLRSMKKNSPFNTKCVERIGSCSKNSIEIFRNLFFWDFVEYEFAIKNLVAFHPGYYVRMEWVIPYCSKLTGMINSRLFINAACINNTEFLKYLFAVLPVRHIEELSSDRKVMTVSLRYSNLETLKLLDAYYFKSSMKGLYYAAERGDIEIVKWFSQKTEFKRYVEQVKNGELDHLFPLEEIYYRAAKSGSLSMLKLLISHFGIDHLLVTNKGSKVWKGAIFSKSIEIMKYLKDTSVEVNSMEIFAGSCFPVDASVSTYAAELNNFEAMKYLYEKTNCPVNKGSIKYACINKNFEMCKYLLRNGCGYDCYSLEYVKRNELNEFIDLLDKYSYRYIQT